ncbi:DUF6397 family protein [Streptomyces sp. NPDC021093]|uniref:DUF6397 family protein n=1 Tax=Streptomyces sp. NPDC021093 TaxID=3365112 RepID=UPI00378A20CC
MTCGNALGLRVVHRPSAIRSHRATVVTESVHNSRGGPSWPYKKSGKCKEFGKYKQSRKYKQSGKFRNLGRCGAGPTTPAPHGTVTAVRAAQELGLRRSEFDLAVQLGRIRTVMAGEGGRRVAREEVDRLRELEATATPLRERLRTAGTTEGAALLHIGRTRFTGLARAGYLSLAKFYLNRYRAVVWLYLVEELTDFKARHPELLTGNYPAAMRTALDRGEDRRARNWRSRRLGQLLARTENPWEQAAIFSSLLEQDELDQVLDDPREAARIAGLRSGLVAAEPRSPAAREIVHRLLVADEEDEIKWIRLSLALSLEEARARLPLPGRATTVAGSSRARAAVPVMPAVPAVRPMPAVPALRTLLCAWMPGLKRRRRADEAH